MTLLSYEGVEVGLPTDLQGIQFEFSAGTLTIHCSNFTGDIVLAKQDGAQTSSPSTASKSKKRTIDLSASASDDDDDEADAKRLRPNFLSDAEQALLRSQLDTEMESADSGGQKGKPKKGKTEPEDTRKATKKTAGKKGKKNSTKDAGDSFFSSEPKQSTSRKKTPESQKKRRQSKAPTPSIIDMMAGPPKPQQPAVIEWKPVQTEDNAPPGRWGHTATKISNNRMVVYGGSDDNEGTLGDLHVLDLKTHTWTTPLNCETITRTWHDAAFLADKNLLLVFGGERNSSVEGELDILSDIMVLDTECFLWYPPVTRGTAPAARSGHTCSVLGSDVVVFGGSKGRNRQSSVHVLDCEEWIWRNVKVEGTVPKARTYHSAVTVGEDKIVYFGGNDSKKSFDGVVVLRKEEKNGDTVWKWEEPAVTGVAPQARTGHSATLLPDGKILIFGGWDPQQAGAPQIVFNDAFLLDTAKWAWQPTTFSGESATERARVGHTTVLDDDGLVLIFGGQSRSEQRLKEICTMRVSTKQEPMETEDGGQSTDSAVASAGSLETESS